MVAASPNVCVHAAHLLAPITPETFLREYFERQPLYLERGGGHYDRWLTCDSLLQALKAISPQLLELKTVRGDATLPGVVDLQRALDSYHRGGTVLANGLHLVVPQVASLCRFLEGFFYHPMQANMYLTPPGNAGFPAHFDTHDNFILQIHGSKHWRVYGEAEKLPFPEQKRVIPPPEQEAPLLDVVLKAGDLLYLPRGFVHAGEALGVASLHLSLGLLSLSWRNALIDLVRLLALEDAELRQSVPLGPWNAGQASDALDRVLKALEEQIRARLLGMAEESFVLDRPVLEPELLLDGGPPLQLTSRVRRNPLVMCLLKNDQLLFLGKRMVLPSASLAAIEHILGSSEPFAVKELPGLEDPDQLRLTRFLWQEGLLQRLS